MKIIHQNGYTTEELALYKHTVYKNLIDCAKALVGAMQQFSVQPQNPDNNAFCDYIIEYQLDPDPNAQMETNMSTAISSIWADPAMPQVFDHSTEFYLMDSAP